MKKKAELLKFKFAANKKKSSPRKLSRKKKTVVVEFSSSESASDDDFSENGGDETSDDDSPVNAPSLPKGTDKNVNIDHCLSDSLVKKIVNDKCFDVNKVYSKLVEIDPTDGDLVPVKLSKGRVGYHPAREAQKI